MTRLATGCPCRAPDRAAPVAEFPGDHGGFLAGPERFGRELTRVLSETS